MRQAGAELVLKCLDMHACGISAAQSGGKLHFSMDRIIVLDESANQTGNNCRLQRGTDVHLRDSRSLVFRLRSGNCNWRDLLQYLQRTQHAAPVTVIPFRLHRQGGVRIEL